MLSATCHCGAVRIEIPQRPRWLTNCNCSICRRYGTLWTYFKRSEVQITAAPGATKGYSWGPKDLRFVRCDTCGCITHWEAVAGDGNSKMGVNARNFDPVELGDVEIELCDGAAF